MDPFQDFLSRIGLDLSAVSSLIRALADHPLLPYSIVTGTLVAGQTSVTLMHGLGRPIYAGYPIGQSAAAALSVRIVAGSTNQTNVVAQVTTALGADLTFRLFCF